MLRRSTQSATPLVIAVAIMAMVTLGAGTAAASGPFLNGIDVSHWQAKPRWVEVKNSGIRFVIAKASNCQHRTDPEYSRNRTRLRKLAIPFTAYHHAQAGRSLVGDAVAEADNFVDAARLDGHNLLPVLELKSTASLSPEHARRMG